MHSARFLFLYYEDKDKISRLVTGVYMYLILPGLINHLMNFLPVRVKGGMSLRNGMWHGLRNDIIMRNVKEMNNTENCTLFCRQSIHRQLFL